MKPFKLFETDELQRAELTIAAKGITEKLQSIAEDLAKIEANELMPMMDQLKAAFGQQLADNFNTTTTTQIRNLLQSVGDAKNEIDNQILRLEGVVNGNTSDDGSDMANNTGFDEPASPEPEVPEASTENDDDDHMFAPEEGSDEAEDERQPPEGRMKKESFQYLDKIIIETFKRLMEMKVNPVKAAQKIAEKHDIQISDVVSIIKEAKKVNEWKMNTPDSKKGMWDDWTVAELKDELKDLMDKETRSKAEQTKVKEIEFAIRAKQKKDKWGKIHESEEKDLDKSKPVVVSGTKDGKEFNKKFDNYTAYKTWCDGTDSDKCDVKCVVNESNLTAFLEAKTVSGNKTSLTKKTAFKKDPGFYIEKHTDGNWHVFGDETGFSYGSFTVKSEARTLFNELSEQKKKAISEDIENTPRTDFTTVHNREEALKKDEYFTPRESMDHVWGAYGNKTGFCYGTADSRDDVMKIVNNLEKLKTNPNASISIVKKEYQKPVGESTTSTYKYKKAKDVKVGDALIIDRKKHYVSDVTHAAIDGKVKIKTDDDTAVHTFDNNERIYIVEAS